MEEPLEEAAQSSPNMSAGKKLNEFAPADPSGCSVVHPNADHMQGLTPLAFVIRPSSKLATL